MLFGYFNTFFIFVFNIFKEKVYGKCIFVAFVIR